MPLLWKQCKYSKQHNKCKQCEPFMWLPPALMVLSLLWQHFTSAGPRGHCKCTVYHYYYHWGKMYLFSGAGCLSMKRGYWELCLSFFPLPCKGKGGVWHILVSGTSYTTKRTKSITSVLVCKQNGCFYFHFSPCFCSVSIISTIRSTWKCLSIICFNILVSVD